jgi:hypothetical protein
MYNSGGTIADALKRIGNRSYVLPAIQREFVWRPEQIERLFDSLMQGYPFGTFLFWKVQPETSGAFKFYEFVREWHERDAAHCPPIGPVHGHAVTAVLDGQQRLTALNIGLRGSMALKRPYARKNKADAYPVQRLRLDLLAPEQPDENGTVYSFKFLDDARAAADVGACWFPVSDIMGMDSGPDMLTALMGKGLEGEALQGAFRLLSKLHNVVHNRQLVNYYEEEDQQLDRVLNIFIRLNSGGTVLSYADLLLSIAVAQWTGDARTEIHGLVDELNRAGRGFALSKDFVLKAGLMLADVASVGFKVGNFTAANMARLEAEWPAIRAALLRTAELVSGFGFSAQTLRADSALLPISYYLYKRGLGDAYLTATQHAADRQRVRDWLVRSYLKPSGIWGSGLDTLLTALRDVIRDGSADGFPVEALEIPMRKRGKSLRFGADEVEDLLDLRYGDQRTFPLLSLLFPFVDLRNEFHVDHVFPQSGFKAGALSRAGFDAPTAAVMAERAQELPNLELLEGPINIEKSDVSPAAWLTAHLPDAEARRHHLDKHLLGDLPDGLDGFDAFFAARRERLRARLNYLLAATDEPEAIAAE